MPQRLRWALGYRCARVGEMNGVVLLVIGPDAEKEEVTRQDRDVALSSCFRRGRTAPLEAIVGIKRSSRVRFSP